MALAAYYLQIKSVHVWAVILSGALFTTRGLLMLAASQASNHPALRYLSYTIDTALLGAALMLAAILHQYPFVHAWLTVKVLLLLLYIVLGSIALKRGRTRQRKLAAFVAALAAYALIVSVARAHHPAGILYTLLHG